MRAHVIQLNASGFEFSVGAWAATAHIIRRELLAWSTGSHANRRIHPRSDLGMLRLYKMKTDCRVERN